VPCSIMPKIILLNEVCRRFLKDVYEDEDGVFVIDINDEGALKSVKNISSVRIVPVQSIFAPFWPHFRFF